MRAGNRWQNLDFAPPPTPDDVPERRAAAEPAPAIGAPLPAGSAGPASGRRAPSLGPPDLAQPAVVTQAIGAYMLRNYAAVLDLLEAPLREQPDMPGGQRAIGLALARLQQESEAMERLRAAASLTLDDWLARAALSSLLLQTDDPDPSAVHRDVQTRAAEAVGHLQAARGAAARPAIRELLGAAFWRVGQEALGASRFREAAAQFAAAAAEFSAAAEVSAAARQALPERQTVTFIGHAVSLLLAGELTAVQALFARSPLRASTAGRPLARFAAGLYELCEELDGAASAERVEAAGSLRDLVLSLKMVVGFYDGRQAVSLTWSGGSS